MSAPGFLAQARQHLAVGASLVALVANLGAPLPAAAQTPATASPIKHVIVIIGENRSFDHVFATYKPKPGETVSNLLSKGIVKADGSPGPNYSLSAQYSAVDSTTVGAGTYSISPPEKTVYINIPPVVAGGPTNAYIPTVAVAKEIEPGQLLSRLLRRSDNWRHRPGPLRGGRHSHSRCVQSARRRLPAYFPHAHLQRLRQQSRAPLLQMWQQADCSVAYSTKENPSGCQSDLFPWVEVTIGAAATVAAALTTRRQTSSPPAKAPPPWNSSTCRRATLLI